MTCPVLQPKQFLFLGKGISILLAGKPWTWALGSPTQQLQRKTPRAPSGEMFCGHFLQIQAEWGSAQHHLQLLSSGFRAGKFCHLSEGQNGDVAALSQGDEHWSLLLGWEHEPPGRGLKTRHEELTLNFNELEMIIKASSRKLQVPKSF